MEMQLPNKRAKTYRFQLSDSQMVEVAKAFQERRMLEPSVSGLKLLNMTLTQLGIRIQLTKWDAHHPLINTIETYLLNCMDEGEDKLFSSITKGVGYLERIAIALEKQNISMKSVSKPVKVAKIKVGKDLKRKNQIQNDSPENRKELGALLAYNRKELAITAAKAAELCPKFEPYVDWTGKARKPLSQFTLSHIECGKGWPSAKQLHSLVVALRIPVNHIRRILELIPEELKTSLEYHNINMLPDSLKDVLPHEQVKVEAQAVEEVLQNVDEQMFSESLPSPAEPILTESVQAIEQPKGLRIGVLGTVGKYWTKHNGNFGNHIVEFIDATKLRQMNGTKYDYLVHTSLHGHKATNRLNNKGNIPVCKLPDGNGGSIPVRTPKQLANWLILNEKGLVA